VNPSTSSITRVSSPLSHLGRASSSPAALPWDQSSSDIVAAPAHSDTSGLGTERGTRDARGHGPPRVESLVEEQEEGARRTTTWLADEVSIDTSKPFPESFFNIDQKGCRKAGISAGTISSVSGIISRAYLHYGRGPRAGPTKSPREGP
jgi:hypothetical protein